MSPSAQEDEPAYEDERAGQEIPQGPREETGQGAGQEMPQETQQEAELPNLPVSLDALSEYLAQAEEKHRQLVQRLEATGTDSSDERSATR